MKIEKPKKPNLNINVKAVKDVLKSKEVRTAAKDIFKAIKDVANTLDVK